MGEPTLITGGKLEYAAWVQDEGADECVDVPFDVTDSAVAYVMEPVRFVGEIYVRDIFSLLDRNPVLVEMFSRAYAAEYLRGQRKETHRPTRASTTRKASNTSNCSTTGKRTAKRKSVAEFTGCGLVVWVTNCAMT